MAGKADRYKEIKRRRERRHKRSGGTTRRSSSRELFKTTTSKKRRSAEEEGWRRTYASAGSLLAWIIGIAVVLAIIATIMR